MPLISISQKRLPTTWSPIFSGAAAGSLSTLAWTSELPGERLSEATIPSGDTITLSVAASSAPTTTLRLNMRIANAATAEFLWAGRHEFRPEDLAAVQTKITRRISRELQVL